MVNNSHFYKQVNLRGHEFRNQFTLDLLTCKRSLYNKNYLAARSAVQIPAILKDAESVAAVVIHAGANDTKLRQTETLKRDFRSLIETVRSTSPAATIIVSGPLPTYRRGHEKFRRLFALNEWLFSWCTEQKILFVNNWNLFWERPRLFRADGLHPSRVGAELLSDNITRTLRSI